MYTRLLVPLDGSETAEKVLPYARLLTAAFRKPVELVSVVDVAAMMAYVSAEKAIDVYDMIQNGVSNTEAYLKGVARTFGGAKVNCAIPKGRPEDIIIEMGESDRTMLVAMATHGRSGVNRWLLGSIAERVLRGASNPLLMIRAQKDSACEGEVVVKSIIAPLDGSGLAESVLRPVAAMAKKLNLEVILLRSSSIPYGVYGFGYGYFAIDVQQFMKEVTNDARGYLEKKAEELRATGVEKISCITREGLAADEIIRLGCETPNSMIAMCSHGRSGMKRWVLGSVTETVVRHCGKPVLVLRSFIACEE